MVNLKSLEFLLFVRMFYRLENLHEKNDNFVNFLLDFEEKDLLSCRSQWRMKWKRRCSLFGLLFCLFVQQENGYRISQLLVSDDEKKGLFTLLPMYVQLKERMNSASVNKQTWGHCLLLSRKRFFHQLLWIFNFI